MPALPQGVSVVLSYEQFQMLFDINQNQSPPAQQHAVAWSTVPLPELLGTQEDAQERYGMMTGQTGNLSLWIPHALAKNAVASGWATDSTCDQAEGHGPKLSHLWI